MKRKSTKGTFGIPQAPGRQGTKGTAASLTPSRNLTKESAASSVLINFRVSPEFRREFKSAAIEQDMSMTELFYRMFDLWKDQA